MKKISITIIALLLVLSIHAQEQTKDKKLSRQEKKELQRKQDEETKKEISDIIDSRQFVFEAYQIMDRELNTYPANSNINFITIDSNKAVFQFGSAASIGINGLGGITIEGEITNFKIQKNERNGYFHLVLKVSSIIGFFDIQFDISPLGTTNVKVTTSDNKKIGYIGEIKSFSNSVIYQGITY